MKTETELNARALERDLTKALQGEVRFGAGDRALYATDGSNYRQVPIGVVVPRSVGDVVETVETTGTVQPVLQVQVGSQVSGRLAHVYVDFNSRVTRGQLLAEIDPTTFRAAVTQARAAVLSAEAQLRRARANEAVTTQNLARTDALRARGLNAPADLETARGQHDMAAADVELEIVGHDAGKLLAVVAEDGGRHAVDGGDVRVLAHLHSSGSLSESTRRPYERHHTRRIERTTPTGNTRSEPGPRPARCFERESSADLIEPEVACR